jgi:nucleotide-binding universal stress UspA family protein
MLRHVLVPLDGSALSEQALYHAQNVIPDGSKLTLLSVIEVPVDYEYSLMDVPLTVVTARAYSESEYNNTHQRIQEYLNNRARKLVEKGYEVEIIVETGDPATVIHDTAAKIMANAIVMTTHGRTGLSRWLFGSVTQKVISNMPCPVLVVPGSQPVESAKPEKASEPEKAEKESEPETFNEPDILINPGLAPT